MQINVVCPNILNNFLTYSSPHLTLQSVQSPGVRAIQRVPLVPLLPIIDGGHQTGKIFSQTIGAERNRQWKTQFIFLVDFGQGNIYEGIWPTDYRRQLAWTKCASLSGGEGAMGGEWPFQYQRLTNIRFSPTDFFDNP